MLSAFRIGKLCSPNQEARGKSSYQLVPHGSLGDRSQVSQGNSQVPERVRRANSSHLQVPQGNNQVSSRHQGNSSHQPVPQGNNRANNSQGNNRRQRGQPSHQLVCQDSQQQGPLSSH